MTDAEVEVEVEKARKPGYARNPLFQQVIEGAVEEGCTGC